MPEIISLHNNIYRFENPEDIVISVAARSENEAWEKMMEYAEDDEWRTFSLIQINGIEVNDSQKHL